MRKYYFRRMSTEVKVYAVLITLFIAFIAYMVLSSGYLQENTFEASLFDEETCMDDKRAFNHAQQPRKSIEDVEDIDKLMVVPFNNMGRGRGLFGVIDIDGSVVVEPTFEFYTQVYDGIIRTVDEDNKATFYDLKLNELPIREASQQFYRAKRLARIFIDTYTNPAYTLMSKSSLSKEVVSHIESLTKLEMFYMSYFKEPDDYYGVRLLSSVHDRVFVVLDKNMDYLIDEYFLQLVHFNENTIAKVNRICTIAYMNMDGEYIWYDDSEY